jgi:hypothetical protein
MFPPWLDGDIIHFVKTLNMRKSLQSHASGGNPNFVGPNVIGDDDKSEYNINEIEDSLA